MTLEWVACDLCAGTDFSPVYAGNLPAEDADPLPYFSSSRRQAGHHPIVRCRGCGLWRSNPRDDPATLQSVYARLRDETYHREEANRARTAGERLRQITRFTPPARLLDAGCASGIFVAQAQRAGWQATGLDPSAWAIQQARRRCPQAGFVTGAIEHTRFAAPFDVITLWDVLEHVASPRRVLQDLCTNLAPGGWLFLNLPNAASLPARLMGPAWVLLLREHLWYFSPATLERLLYQTGYTLVACRPNRVRFSLANIFTRLAQYPHLHPAARLAQLPGAARIAFRFSIGEMFVAARKISLTDC